MIYYETIQQFNDMLGVETLHPMVSVVHLDDARPMHHMLHTLDAIKRELADPSKSIGEVAYSLGFQYQQHLSRFFKKETGMTPAEYRLKSA